MAVTTQTDWGYSAVTQACPGHAAEQSDDHVDIGFWKCSRRQVMMWSWFHSKVCLLCFPLGQNTVIKHLQRLRFKACILRRLAEEARSAARQSWTPSDRSSARLCAWMWRLRLLSYCLVMQMTLFLQVQCSKKISLGASWVWISWILSCIVWPSGT